VLTKELLLYTARKGRLYPRFIDVEDEALLGVADALVGTAKESIGLGAGELEESLEAIAKDAGHLKLGQGLVKLVLDRIDVEAASPEQRDRRLAQQRIAAGVLRGLPAGASLEAYEAALELAIEGGLEKARLELYADLPERRRVNAVDLDSGAALLRRYNLALAQSLLLYARRLLVRLIDPPKLELRRALRWLRFCRLVAEVDRHGSDLVIGIDGPAAMFDGGRKYGLELAMFFEVLPLFPRWALAAEVTLPRRPALQLELDEKAPVVSPLSSGLGHVPEEIETTLQKIESNERFEVDRSPEPRAVGVNGLIVPDLALKDRASGRWIAIELFHGWHKGALSKRLEALRARPDPDLLLGVDRAILKSDPSLEGQGQVFAFNKFPGERVLVSAIDAWIRPAPAPGR
jgi:uncharacterized protein